MKKIINLSLVLLLSGSLNAINEKTNIRDIEWNKQSDNSDNIELEIVNQEQSIKRLDRRQQKRRQLAEQKLMQKAEQDTLITSEESYTQNLFSNNIIKPSEDIFGKNIFEEQDRQDAQNVQVNVVDGVADVIDEDLQPREVIANTQANIFNKGFSSAWRNKGKIALTLATIWAAIEAGSIAFDSLPRSTQKLLIKYIPNGLSKLRAITVKPETIVNRINMATNDIANSGKALWKHIILRTATIRIRKTTRWERFVTSGKNLWNRLFRK